ncbi:hypothetical protein LINPERPRIM_LOCUS43333 [Linum perenne]
MMDDTTSSVSCLAVVDNRPPKRPGGCVGIFFHLFHWNRRFAKRNLFSNKLLPPASNKFAADEKMPKSNPHLLTDENKNGAFPQKNGTTTFTELQKKKQEMRPPSLVAKLMGLDSMPVQRDKHSNNLSNPADPASDFKVNTIRPQKLQKTGGQSDRNAVTRFGAEALQIRNVLLSRTSSSRKQHSHIAATKPAKSPKFLSPSTRHASRTSRLIDAATRILEPGLQATHRAKSAIAYSNSMRFDSRRNYDEVVGGGMGQSIKEQLGESNLGGQASCSNCGNLVNVVVGSTLHLEEEEQQFFRSSLACQFANSCHGSSMNNQPPMTYSNQGRDAAACKRKQTSDTEMQDKARTCSEVTGLGVDRQAMPHEFGARFRQFPSPAAGFKQRTQSHKRISIENDGLIIPRSNFTSNIESSRTKDFIAMNRRLSGRSRPRVSNRMDNPTLNMERKFINRRDDGLPPLRRKRRMVSVNAQRESSGLGNSTMPLRQRNIHMGVNTSPGRTRSGIQAQGGGNKSISTGGVTSFTFSSPSRLKTGRLDDRRNQIVDKTTDQTTQMIDDCQRKSSVGKPELPRRDVLGALLQEKLKELICQEENEGENGQPIRSTASILQELISALTIEQPTSPPSSFPNVTTPFQNGRKLMGSSVVVSLDSDHLSPGSVLDASFSTESCFSSSLDDNSVCRLLPGIVDNSYDMDHWDSLICTTKGRTFVKLVTNMLDHISRILQSINLAGGCQWTSRDLYHAKETILTAELLFGCATGLSSDRVRSSVLGHFLLYELNALSIHIKPDGNNQLDRRLLLDCVIEWLDWRYRKYCDSGYRTWRQLLPMQWCTGLVIKEVGEEMKRWTKMAGMIPDEIVDLEIGQSIGKWTELEIESSEIGVDIAEALLEETVNEFWVL